MLFNARRVGIPTTTRDEQISNADIRRSETILKTATKILYTISANF